MNHEGQGWDREITVRPKAAASCTHSIRWRDIQAPFARSNPLGYWPLPRVAALGLLDTTTMQSDGLSQPTVTGRNAPRCAPDLVTTTEPQHFSHGHPDLRVRRTFLPQAK